MKHRFAGKHMLCWCCLLFCAFTTALSAQTYKEIISSDKYIWGEGTGKSSKAANDEALAQISEQISVFINSQEALVSSYQSNNSKYNLDVELESIVETYSATTLTMCQKMVLENGPKKYKILRYIKKSEIDKVFAMREEKIREMLRVAERAEEEMKLDVALKHYYWAQSLTRTLLYPNKMTYLAAEGEVLPVVWIPNQITNLLKELTFAFDGFTDETNTLGRLHIWYKNQPVTSLDYSYWDGFDWSQTIGAKDGLGTIELRADSAVKSVNIKVEYAYDNEVHLDPDLENIAGMLSTQDYPAATINNVRLEVQKQPTVQPEKKQNQRSQKTEQESVMAQVIAAAQAMEERTATIKPTERTYEFTEVTDASLYQNNLEQVLNALEKDQSESIRDYFTEEGFEIYTQLLKYGNAKVLERKQVNALNFEGQIFCRSIPMRFSFRTNDKKFVEDVVFVFEQDGKISSINFALESATVQEIVSKSKWSDGMKMSLITFLENYKTAFALKRLEYISSIFSDDALIITGRKVRKANVENGLRLNQADFEYNRQTKTEYIDNLSRSFNSKEYINLKFSNIEVIKFSKGFNENLFSIQIKQDYYSSNYGDTGYLFLQVDINDYQKPVIHIRTWQPEPDPDFGLYGPGSF